MSSRSGGGRELGSATAIPHLQGSWTVRFRLHKRDVAQKSLKGARVSHGSGWATSVSRLCKLHLGRCDKASALPALPFLTWLPSYSVSGKGLNKKKKHRFIGALSEQLVPLASAKRYFPKKLLPRRSAILQQALLFDRIPELRQCPAL